MLSIHFEIFFRYTLKNYYKISWNNLMRAIEKVNLVRKISVKLQEEMTFSEIDMFLAHFGIQDIFGIDRNSKRIYVQVLLADTDKETILKIADELNIQNQIKSTKNETITFWKKDHFKLFISHLAKYKINASYLQKSLEIYGISSFVAHEDIEPSQEWQIEIEKALHSMDGFTAILMKGFKESNWCDQEIGFAIAKEVLIIPIKKELDPYGFIGKYQAIQPKNKSVSQVAEEIFNIIVKHEKTRILMLEKLSSLIANSTHINTSRKQLESLATVESLPRDIIEKMMQDLNNNKVLSTSKVFIDDFKKMVKKYNINYIPILEDPPNINSDIIPF